MDPGGIELWFRLTVNTDESECLLEGSNFDEVRKADKKNKFLHVMVQQQSCYLYIGNKVSVLELMRRNRDRMGELSWWKHVTLIKVNCINHYFKSISLR